MGGCGALNGDPDVKRCSLWIATPLAGKEMRILCDPSQGEFSMSFERVGCQFGRASTVADLKNRLHSIPKWINHIGTVEILNEYKSCFFWSAVVRSGGLVKAAFYITGTRQ